MRHSCVHPAVEQTVVILWSNLQFSNTRTSKFHVCPNGGIKAVFENETDIIKTKQEKRESSVAFVYANCSSAILNYTNKTIPR